MFFFLGASVFSSKNPKGVPTLGLSPGENCYIYDSNGSNRGYFIKQYISGDEHWVKDWNASWIGRIKTKMSSQVVYDDDGEFVASYHPAWNGNTYVYDDNNSQVGHTEKKNGKLWFYDSQSEWQGVAKCLGEKFAAGAIVVLLKLKASFNYHYYLLHRNTSTNIYGVFS